MSNYDSETPRMEWAKKILKQLAIGVALTLVAGTLVTFLWNAILPKVIDGVNALTFFQGVGLLVLSRILFYSGWLTPSRPSLTNGRRQTLPEEDRAAFLSRVRQRLADAEAQVERSGSWGPGNRE